MSKVNRSNSASKTRNLETPKSSSTTAGQQKVGACINISNAVKAEISWALKIVDCGFSLWSSGNQSTKNKDYQYLLMQLVDKMYVFVWREFKWSYRVFWDGPLCEILKCRFQSSSIEMFRFHLSWPYKTPGFINPF